MSVKRVLRDALLQDGPGGIERWLYWCLTKEGFMPLDATEREREQIATLPDRARRAAWAEHGPALLAEHIAHKPGTRPSGWWRFGAPKTPTKRHPHITAAQRLRLGGRGTPAHDVLNLKPRFHLGIPCEWVTDWDIAYYTGRARDVAGNPIGTEFIRHAFPAEPFDPADPPTFESQAAFLKRHGLLTEDEASRLTAQHFAAARLPTQFFPTKGDNDEQSDA